VRDIYYDEVSGKGVIQFQAKNIGFTFNDLTHGSALAPEAQPQYLYKVRPVLLTKNTTVTRGPMFKRLFGAAVASTDVSFKIISIVPTIGGLTMLDTPYAIIYPETAVDFSANGDFSQFVGTSSGY